MQQGLLQLVQRFELALVEGFEALSFFLHGLNAPNNLGLPFNILHGKMTQTAHGVFGQLWVHVVATEEQVNNILADLRHSDIEGEVIKHA